jgi:predicted metal-dependent HD superfamily phosphohydrolase
MRFTLARWNDLCRAAHLPESPTWFQQLSKHYSEPHRHYHNIQHLEECLTEFDRLRPQASNPLALEFAIFFHDAIYDPRRTDNEEQSAALAAKCLKDASPHLTKLVSALILTTKAHLPNDIPDATLLLDIDLSILGKPAARFAEYETQIRKEYSFVPLPIYAEKRATILRNFLSRPKIFTTEFFDGRFETQAQSNLRKSIALLERKSCSDQSNSSAC